MSFVKALATLAVGFAAAKGIDKYKKMGGMAGVQDAMRSASQDGGIADQFGSMAEKMGIPGGKGAVRDLFDKFSQTMAGATEAGQAGLGGLISAISGGAAAGSAVGADMISAMTAGTPVSTLMEDNARLMIRAMIQAAKADGEIDADEQKQILSHMSGASAEEIAFVKEELSRPIDVASLAADTQQAMKAQVYATSLMAIRVDSSAERSYLKNLAAALQLDEATRDRLHAAMGVTAEA